MADENVDPARLASMVDNLKMIIKEFEDLSAALKTRGLPPIRLQIRTREKQVRDIRSFALGLKSELQKHIDLLDAGRSGADRKAADRKKSSRRSKAS